MKRIISAILAVLMLLPLTGCLNEETSDVDETSVVTKTETAVNDESALELPDDLDYEGYTFTYLTTNGGGTLDFMLYDPFSMEESTGETLHDEVYNAIRRTEERLNVDLVSNLSSTVTNQTQFSSMILAGDTDVDLAFYIDRFALKLAVDGYLYPYTNISNIDFDNPWWYKYMNEELSFKDVNYFGSSAFCFIPAYTHVLFFNKNLFDDMNYSYPYQDVRDGTWTIDKLYSYINSFASDIDGDGKMTDLDMWGAVYCENIWYNDFGPASDEYIISKDSGGDFIYNVPGNERLISIWSKVYDYESLGNTYNMNLKDSKNYQGSDVYSKMLNMFSSGGSLFMSSVFCYAMELSAMEDDFGIIPFPRYEEGNAGTQYNAYMSGAITQCIPVTAPDPERTGAVLETLAYEYYTKVIPTFLNETLTVKKVRDNDSIEMIELMSNSFHADLSIAYWFDLLAGQLYASARNKSNTFVSDFEVKRENVEASITEVNEAIKRINNK